MENCYRHLHWSSRCCWKKGLKRTITKFNFLIFFCILSKFQQQLSGHNVVRITKLLCSIENSTLIEDFTCSIKLVNRTNELCNLDVLAAPNVSIDNVYVYIWIYILVYLKNNNLIYIQGTSNDILQVYGKIQENPNRYRGRFVRNRWWHETVAFYRAKTIGARFKCI